MIACYLQPTSWVNLQAGQARVSRKLLGVGHFKGPELSGKIYWVSNILGLKANVKQGIFNFCSFLSQLVVHEVDSWSLKLIHAVEKHH